jgi:hypothetical protein
MLPHAIGWASILSREEKTTTRVRESDANRHQP